MRTGLNTVAIGITAAALALTATAGIASAESAVAQSRAKLDAAFAAERLSDRSAPRTANRQVTSGASLGFFDRVFGADVSFGVADITPVDRGADDVRRFGIGDRGGN